MADDTQNTQDYFEDPSNEGHTDTRGAYENCADPDPNLGCDLGIDVAG